jgi:hypothetical protein
MEVKMPPSSIEKTEAACTSETLPTSIRCENPNTELISTMNHHESLKSTFIYTKVWVYSCKIKFSFYMEYHNFATTIFERKSLLLLLYNMRTYSE